MNIEEDLKRSKRAFNRSQVPMPPTTQWREDFLKGHYQDLDIEVGCGVGLHPIRYSQKNSDRFLVAIEHTKNKFESFERRVRNHPHIKNLKAIHANAISWITHELNDNEVSRFIFLYPNPYPKIADRPRRFYAMPFMDEVVRKLKPGGEIWFATNVKDYAVECEYFLTQRFALKKTAFRALSHEMSDLKFEPRTHFEKKYLLRGDICFDLVFKLDKKS